MRLTVEPSTDPAAYEFAHRIRVRFVETDAMGIVHHSNYLAYFEEARVAFLAHLGHPYTSWRAEGLQSPVLETFLTYRQPCRFDEEITVHLALAAVTRATFQMNYLVTADGSTATTEVRTTGSTVHGCTTIEGRPTRLPEWLRRRGANLSTRG